MTKAFVFAVLALTGAAADAAAQAPRNFCRFPGIRFCDGCVVNRNIVVRTGSVCGFNSRTTGALLGHDIVARPQLGVFGMANEYQAAYRAGATPGRDYFEYRIRWERLGRVNAMTIRNHVRVIPATGPAGPRPAARSF